jgi:hypothetical protein
MSAHMDITQRDLECVVRLQRHWWRYTCLR